MQILLSDRQREILRPRRRGVRRDRAAGRLEDARRAGGARRLALDRAQRARRARAARAADASAHLGRPCADRGRVPHLRRRAARAARSRGRPSSRSELPAARAEVEEALQATTEMLSQVTRLLALVSAPPLEAATVRHVEVLLLQPERRDGGRDHVDGQRHRPALRVPGAGRPGARDVGGRVPRRAARAARASARAPSSCAFDEPSLSPARAGVPAGDPRRVRAGGRREPAALRRRGRRACSTRCAPRRSARTAA